MHYMFCGINVLLILCGCCEFMGIMCGLVNESLYVGMSYVLVFVVSYI